MKKLAIAYVACDKFDDLWLDWYEAHLKHWDLDVPKYFCGEEKPCPFDGFEQIPHEAVGAGMWTAKLRKQVEQIDAEYIFVWLDDMVQLRSISEEFDALFKWAYKRKVDSIRIMGRPSKARYTHVIDILDNPVYSLNHDSQYLVSFSPNVFKKEFLLKVLKRDESPWACEVAGTNRIRKSRPDVYAQHIDGWYINRRVNGQPAFLQERIRRKDTT